MKQRVLTSIENLSKIVYSLLIWDNDMTTAQVCPAIFSLIFFLFPGFALSQFVGTSYIGPCSWSKIWAIMNLFIFFLGCFVSCTKQSMEEITLYEHDWSAYHWKLSWIVLNERKKPHIFFWDQQLKPNIFSWTNLNNFSSKTLKKKRSAASHPVEAHASSTSPLVQVSLELAKQVLEIIS